MLRKREQEHSGERARESVRMVGGFTFIRNHLGVQYFNEIIMELILHRYRIKLLLERPLRLANARLQERGSVQGEEPSFLLSLPSVMVLALL